MQNNKTIKQAKKNFKVALVLGAGGAKGLAHIGVLKALNEAGIKFDMIVGSSMGAIVGSCYALGVKPIEMEERANKLSTKDIIDLQIPNNYGFIKGNKAEQVIRDLLNAKESEPTFSDCKIPFACVASDITKAELVKLKRGKIIPSVRASFSICGVFKPVEIGGRKLLDGGIFCRVPVNLAREMGADCVIAVDCIGKTIEEDVSSFKYADTLARIFNIMDYQISEPEMNSADVLVSISQPEISSVKINNVNKSIQNGYNAIKHNITKIKRTILEKYNEFMEGK